MAAAVAGLVVSASACGGGGKKTDTTSASVQWASSVCSAFTDWKTSLQDIKTNLTAGGLSSLSDATLRQAERKANDATNTLTRTLKNLGAPNTTGGAAAKASLDTLEASLSESMSTIEAAVPRNPSPADLMSALPTVTGQVTKMANDLTTAVDSLKQADPGGELQKAFHDAPSCSAYVAS
jgi:hypothetical protein